MTRWWLTPIAGTAALAAAMLVVHVSMRPIGTAPPSGAAPAVESAAGAAPATSLRLDRTRSEDFPEMLRRPLFWPERRPGPTPSARVDRPSASASSDPHEMPPGLRLAGVLGGVGRMQALIVSPGEPGGRWIPEGGEIDGWRLDRIEMRSVHLRARDRSFELKLQ